jgi:hypothetical protein
MNSIEVINNIESKFPVEEIKAEGFPLWQFLRYRYYITHYFIKEAKSNSGYYLSNSTNILNLIYNSLISFIPFRKRFKYILFTDSKELKNIDGKVSDKIAHEIISVLGDELIVSINTSNEISSSKNLFFKNSLNSAIFYFFSIFHKRKTKIENEIFLKNIEKDLMISVDYQKKTDRFFALVRVLDKYFKRNKFKIVFVNAYYSPVLQQAVIYSANKNKIKTIELQHGIINNSHIAYNIFKKIGNEALPQNLFLFGDYFKQLLSDSQFLSADNLFVTGSFFINYSIENNKKNKFASDFFNDARKKYKKIVAVTSQETIENELIEFINQVAYLDKEILYIFIPRNFEKEFPGLIGKPNIIIDKRLDFYLSASYVDFHATVYSTCALESLAFGTSNILININGLSKKFLGNNLKEDKFSYYVENTKEMLNILSITKVTDKELVKAKGNYFFVHKREVEIDQIIKNIEDGL